MDKINKIKSVKIKNFKGYYGEHNFNTDGDIVLLIGPNGYGKTSFIEALTLALSGHFEVKAGHDEFDKKMIIPVGEEILNPEIILTRELKDKEEYFVWDAKKHITKKDDNFEIKSIFHDRTDFTNPIFTDNSLSELNSRISSFFQDKIDFLFDETVNGRTILDVVTPDSKSLKKVKKELKNLIEELDGLKKEKEDFSSKKTYDQIIWELQEFSKNFSEGYNLFEKKSGFIWPKIKAPFDTGNDAFDFFKKAMGGRWIKHKKPDADFETNLIQLIIDDLDNWIKELEKKAVGKTDDGEKIQKKIDEFKKNINDINKRYPKLDEEITLFNGKSEKSADALDVLSSIIENTEKWSKPEFPNNNDNETKHLKIIIDEFKKVKLEKAIACKNSLESWIKKRKEFFDLRKDYDSQIDDLEKDLEKYKFSKELEEAKRAKKAIISVFDEFMESLKAAFIREDEIKRKELRKNAVDLVEEYKNHLKTISRKMENKALDLEYLQSILKNLETAVNKVAKRFSFVEGVLPIDLEHKKRGDDKEDFSTISSTDNRKLYHFSTGQKAQLGISSLVAQNSLLSNFLNHKIIMLDDMTTSYDLSNLTRESILWRQLAYGLKSDHSLKRQIFISTHHEDLTNNLIELLAPPHGRELRLIKFEGWKRNKGPIFKQFRVEPCNKIEKDKNLEKFAKDLSNLF